MIELFEGALHQSQVDKEIIEGEKIPDNFGPLHSAVHPAKFKPIVTKRSFHIK